MNLRPYHPSDVVAMAELFYSTVHEANAAHYTEQQLDAWADGTPDLKSWNEKYLSTYTVVAEDSEGLLGFGNIDKSGYLDMLYVRCNALKSGVGSAICDELEGYALAFGAKTISVFASITAKPFFLKRGYEIISENSVKRNSQELTNYYMRKDLKDAEF